MYYVEFIPSIVQHAARVLSASWVLPSTHSAQLQGWHLTIQVNGQLKTVTVEYTPCEQRGYIVKVLRYDSGSTSQALSFATLHNTYNTRELINALQPYSIQPHILTCIIPSKWCKILRLATALIMSFNSQYFALVFTVYLDRQYISM